METNKELLKGNTPTLVLAVLNDGPLHGYGIARELERRSSDALKFKEGTLYPALHTLEREELIAGEWRREPGGRERRIYHITPAGKAALAERITSWNQFSAAIRSVIGGQDNATTPSGSEAALKPEPAC